MLLGSGLEISVKRLDVVALHAYSFGKHDSAVELRKRVPLFGCLAILVNCLGRVRHHSVTTEVDVANTESRQHCLDPRHDASVSERSRGFSER